MSHVTGAVARRAPRATPSVKSLRAVLPREIAEQLHATSPLHSCSNTVTALALRDGRRIVLKRGRYEWDRQRFHASRVAAGLLRRRTGVIAPSHLFTGDIEGRAAEAYWLIELPTLRELWPGLPERARPRALRSWGTLLRRVHKVRLAGHGPLPRAERHPATLADFLRAELEARLAPAVAEAWPAARASVAALGGLAPEIAARLGGGAGVLLHNDPHLGNVLCAPHGRGIRCVGVLDLEAAMGGPPESDLAHVQVLHGPLLGQPLPGAWFEHMLEGYGSPADPVALRFFRAYHLVNLGYHAALVGDGEHARQVGRATAAEVRALRRDLLAA
ncbi:MAG TPA: aminoglycoside phosphotransferase family protein [Gemmatimonadaceae bacterium]|nr:aminoglycoside phosphotransferase family protein [Gemmatimonadaceae bacterium]